MINNINVNTREQTFRGSALFHNKGIRIPNNSYKKIEKNSPEFIKECYKFFRSTFNRPVEINVETERLMDIVNSDESFIFVMNHTSKSIFDVFAAKFFNALLYREYLYKNIGEKCPRSKVLANSRILDKKSDNGEYYRWMGVLPLKVSLFDKNAKQQNSKILDDVSNEISQNKTNLFVFPEGALLPLTFLPLKYKFQPGVSAIIRRVLELKDSVKVIPLGFAHNLKETAIHIGKPVEFSKKQNRYFVSSGNKDSDFFDKNLSNFYSGRDKILITEQGKEVDKEHIVPYFSGVLSANLECCKKEAKRDLKTAQKEVFEL